MPSLLNPLIILIFSAIFVWLLALSLFLYRTVSHYNRLGRGVIKQDLTSLLEKILENLDLSQKQVEQLRAHCDKIEQEGLLHVRKVGLVRFNPFSDTGGDQSFIIALLNGRDDGILFSSLHGRSGTRWYAKTIQEGKGVEHELSSEEKTAIKKAKVMYN